MIDKQKIYDEKYGSIPKDQDERVRILSECKSENKQSLFDKILNSNVLRISKIKTQTFAFVWHTIPVPSHRPRANTRMGYPQIYVPGARENLTGFQKFFKEAYPDFKMIETPMTIEIKAYAPTPGHFNKVERVMAEMKLIRPWGRVFDMDNVYKATTDQIIGSVILDDSLIDTIYGYKYYSSKPRIEYHIRYMKSFPKVVSIDKDKKKGG